MSNSIAGITNVNQPQTTPSAGSGQTLGSQQFLELLTTELRNQDPLKPMDDTQSVAQLAQFSALQSTNELNASFKAFQSNFGVLQAATLIGKKVTVVTPTANGGQTATQTGTVSTISVQNGQPYFTMNGSNGKAISDNNGNPLLFSTSEITGIGN